MTLKQVMKSKTIDVNVAAGILLPVLIFFGVDLSVEEVGAFFAVINIGLRFLTNRAVSEK